MKNIKSTKGFTLIEALIVVIIVGLLAAVGVVKLGGAKTDTLIGLSKSAAGEINKGLQRSIVANGGLGYTAANVDMSVATDVQTTNVINALIAEGHFTAASGAAMIDAIGKAAAISHGITITKVTAGTAQATATTTLKAVAEGGYEAGSL